MNQTTKPRQNADTRTRKTEKARGEQAFIAPAIDDSLTWCREHPPMGDGIVAASISSGRKCA